MLLFFNSSVIISHFGVNPDSGGRPPRDRRMVAIKGIVMGCLFHDKDTELIVMCGAVMSIKNIEAVMRI